MNAQTVLLRQIHPNFIPNGELSSQAFFPFPKDDGRLSVYDGDQVNAGEAYLHYIDSLGNQSAGVWGVSCGEVLSVNLTSNPAPLPNFSAHACIDFGARAEKECRRLAKSLKKFAILRGCLHDG